MQKIGNLLITPLVLLATALSLMFYIQKKQPDPIVSHVDIVDQNVQVGNGNAYLVTYGATDSVGNKCQIIQLKIWSLPTMAFKKGY